MGEVPLYRGSGGGGGEVPLKWSCCGYLGATGVTRDYGHAPPYGPSVGLYLGA